MLALTVFDATVPVRAQEADAWESPQLIFGTTGRASHPVLTSDESGYVHLFWEYGAPGHEDEGAYQSIYYSRFDQNSWSVPVDVVFSRDDKVARGLSAVTTNDWRLHLVWSAGDEILYSSAESYSAESALAWSVPLSLAAGPPLLEPFITSDGETLFVVWTQAGEGLMFSISQDGGASWSAPNLIFPARNSNELARYGRMAVDEAGRLHVVLTHVVDAIDDSTADMYLYYLVSEDNGRSWTAPHLLDDSPDFGQVNVVTYSENIVHVTWNGRAGHGGRYHRWSSDRGRTWSVRAEIVAPTQNDGLGSAGLTGPPAMFAGEDEILHFISAAKGSNYYVRWSRERWGDPVIISGNITGDGVTNTYNDTMEAPSMVLSRDGYLYAAMQDGNERIWITKTRIFNGETPLVAVPAPTAQPTPPLTPDSTESPIHTRSYAGLNSDQARSVTRLTLILLMLAPPVCLIAIVIRLRSYRR